MIDGRRTRSMELDVNPNQALMPFEELKALGDY
jgi:hypothetical protein